LHAAADALWVRGGQAFLQKVDPDSLALLEEITAPETSDGSVLLAYDALWATAYDDAVLYRLRPSG
jgi:glutamine cyclotransferase